MHDPRREALDRLERLERGEWTPVSPLAAGADDDRSRAEPPGFERRRRFLRTVLLGGLGGLALGGGALADCLLVQTITQTPKTCPTTLTSTRSGTMSVSGRDSYSWTGTTTVTTPGGGTASGTYTYSSYSFSADLGGGMTSVGSSVCNTTFSQTNSSTFQNGTATSSATNASMGPWTCTSTVTLYRTATTTCEDHMMSLAAERIETPAMLPEAVEALRRQCDEGWNVDFGV